MSIRYYKRRSIYAILLLMVMALQMGFKTFHLHHHVQTTEVACSDCDHHRVHSGHLVAWDGDTDNCPLCQMLASPYVPAQELRMPQAFVQIQSCSTAYLSHVAEVAWCRIIPRGPPSHCFIIRA